MDPRGVKGGLIPPPSDSQELTFEVIKIVGGIIVDLHSQLISCGVSLSGIVGNLKCDSFERPIIGGEPWTVKLGNAIALVLGIFQAHEEDVDAGDDSGLCFDKCRRLSSFSELETDASFCKAFLVISFVGELDGELPDVWISIGTVIISSSEIRK